MEHTSSLHTPFSAWSRISSSLARPWLALRNTLHQGYTEAWKMQRAYTSTIAPLAMCSWFWHCVRLQRRRKLSSMRINCIFNCGPLLVRRYWYWQGCYRELRNRSLDLNESWTVWKINRSYLSFASSFWWLMLHGDASFYFDSPIRHNQITFNHFCIWSMIFIHCTVVLMFLNLF